MIVVQKPIVLMGLSGSGKSTVGEHLAKLLGLPFYDSDAITEALMGCRIGEAVDTKGEGWFRCQERAAMHELVEDVPVGVVAAAGGAIQDPVTARLVRTYTTGVWLLAPTSVLCRRLATDPTDRPLLRTDPHATLERMFAQRGTNYAEASRHHVWADRAPEEVAQTVLEALSLAGPSCCGASGERWHPCPITRPWRADHAQPTR